MSSNIMSRLALPMASARNVEELTRSVLAMMEIYTGLESSYFVMIDPEDDFVTVRFSHNSKNTLVIPEGASAPWAGTLCKRSLEDPTFEENMRDICDEYPRARALGLKTYATCPVRLADGELYGVLCVASKDAKSLPAESKDALAMFAKVIEQQAQREVLFKRVAASMRKSAGLAASGI